MHDFDDFIKIVRELIAFFSDLTAVEAEKLEAAEHNRVTFVEELMKKEQVAILRLKGLDKTREAIQKDLGWEGMPFRDILSHVNDDEKNTLEPLLDRLHEEVKVFQNTSDSARQVLEVNLHTVSTLLAQQQGDSEGYTSEGFAATQEQLSGKVFKNTRI